MVPNSVFPSNYDPNSYYINYRDNQVSGVTVQQQGNSLQYGGGGKATFLPIGMIEQAGGGKVSFKEPDATRYMTPTDYPSMLSDSNFTITGSATKSKSQEIGLGSAGEPMTTPVAFGGKAQPAIPFSDLNKLLFPYAGKTLVKESQTGYSTPTGYATGNVTETTTWPTNWMASSTSQNQPGRFMSQEESSLERLKALNERVKKGEPATSEWYAESTNLARIRGAPFVPSLNLDRSHDSENDLSTRLAEAGKGAVAYSPSLLFSTIDLERSVRSGNPETVAATGGLVATGLAYGAIQAARGNPAAIGALALPVFGGGLMKAAGREVPVQAKFSELSYVTDVGPKEVMGRVETTVTSGKYSATEQVGFTSVKLEGKAAKVGDTGTIFSGIETIGKEKKNVQGESIGFTGEKAVDLEQRMRSPLLGLAVNSEEGVIGSIAVGGRQPNIGVWSNAVNFFTGLRQKIELGQRGGIISSGPGELSAGVTMAKVGENEYGSVGVQRFETKAPSVGRGGDLYQSYVGETRLVSGAKGSATGKGMLIVPNELAKGVGGEFSAAQEGYQQGRGQMSSALDANTRELNQPPNTGFLIDKYLNQAQPAMAQASTGARGMALGSVAEARNTGMASAINRQGAGVSFGALSSQTKGFAFGMQTVEEQAVLPKNTLASTNFFRGGNAFVTEGLSTSDMLKPGYGLRTTSINKPDTSNAFGMGFTAASSFNIRQQTQPDFVMPRINVFVEPGVAVTNKNQLSNSFSQSAVNENRYVNENTFVNTTGFSDTSFFKGGLPFLPFALGKPDFSSGAATSGRGGFFGGRSPRSYSPSLLGLMSGKTIRRAPKSVTGLEIRFPVMPFSGRGRKRAR
jgi:hypothetical protein